MASGDALPFNAISAIPYLFLGRNAQTNWDSNRQAGFKNSGSYFPTLIRSETILFACP
jgi:hypothetical protein